MGPDNKSAKRDFKAIPLPSLGLDYNLSENLKIYANVSRGFSNPNLEETLTPDGVINPDIAQETGTNYELGTNLYLDDKKFNINLVIYQMDIRNLLVAERVGEDQFIGKNAGKTKHQGLELAMDYSITINPKIALTPFINYTFNNHKFVEYIDEENDFSGNPLTGVPKQFLTLGSQLRLFDDFYMNITLQHVGTIPLTDANSLSSEPFTVLMTRMGYRKKLSDKFTVGIDFGVNNLFNAVYVQSVLINAKAFGGREPRYYYPGNERNYYTSLRLGYQL